MAPKAIVEAFYARVGYLRRDQTEILLNTRAQIPGAFRYNERFFGFPCRQRLPRLHIAFDAEAYQLSSKHFNLGPFTG